MRPFSPREITSGGMGEGGSSLDTELAGEASAWGRWAETPDVQSNSAISPKPRRLTGNREVMNNRK